MVREYLEGKLAVGLLVDGIRQEFIHLIAGFESGDLCPDSVQRRGLDEIR